MTDLSIEFRQADDSAWVAIWHIVNSTLLAANTYPHSPETTEPEGRVIWLGSDESSREVYVAESGGEVVATAFLKPNQPLVPVLVMYRDL